MVMVLDWKYHVPAKLPRPVSTQVPFFLASTHGPCSLDSRDLGGTSCWERPLCEAAVSRVSELASTDADGKDALS